MIIEAPGLAEFKHQISKDTAVVAKEFHQQPDQQPADSADQESEKARINAKCLGGLFPQKIRPLMDKSHKGKGDQGADQSQHGNQHQEPDI